MAHTIPVILQWDESFDIGSDTGTPVDDKDYQCPFPAHRADIGAELRLRR
jgi:hypothetical protein